MDILHSDAESVNPHLRPHEAGLLESVEQHLAMVTISPGLTWSIVLVDADGNETDFDIRQFRLLLLNGTRFDHYDFIGISSGTHAVVQP